jgi:hypothetical protein
MRRVLLTVAIASVAAACVDRLPDQDRRITVAVPAYKLSADLLWKEYKADAAQANRKYWGKAIEISGAASRVESDASRIVFEQESPQGVAAGLLDDQAKDILAAVKPGDRVMLRCYCSGLAGGDVVLKSCVRPGA